MVLTPLSGRTPVKQVCHPNSNQPPGIILPLSRLARGMLSGVTLAEDTWAAFIKIEDAQTFVSAI